MDNRPHVTRCYQNHSIDSLRWQSYVPRDDDVIISTSMKAGTTWMQTIVANLIFPNGNLPGAVDDISPWIDCPLFQKDMMFATIEAQEHRRFLKSHLPLDAIPYFDNVKYIMVARDARDVFMSMWNHYSNFTPRAYELVNENPGLKGDPLPRPDGNIRSLWHQWMTRGSFEWEHDGWPFWSHLHHAQSWWEWKDLPNILLVHYNNLLMDLPAEIRRIASYLGIAVPEEFWPRVVESATFEFMKKNANQLFATKIDPQKMWKGGAQTFINKGTNGRWRDVLTEDDLALYHRATKRTLSQDCAWWLESGILPQRYMPMS